MSRISLILASAIALAVTGCASVPASPTPNENAKHNTIGGEYIVSHFPGVPSVDGAPAVAADPWVPTQFKQIQGLDYQCHAQLDKYIPAMSDDIANLAVPMSLKTGIGAAVGSALAVAGKVTGVSFWDYLKEVGYSSAGSAFGSGETSAEDRHRLAVRYVQYACMTGFVARAQQKGHILKGVGINPWAGTGPAIRQHMPTGSEIVQGSSSVDTSSTSSSSESEDDTTSTGIVAIP